jgi:hypothetical protein
MNYVNQQAGPAAPMQPLPGAIDLLSVSMNDLGVTAEVLVGRLGRVLSPPGPPTATEGRALNAACSPTSDMVADVNGLRERIASITARLQDALNRLEV